MSGGNNILCFDVSSGGISAAVLDERLRNLKIAEAAWSLETGRAEPGVLAVDRVFEAFADSIRGLRLAPSDSIRVVSIGAFLHSSVLLDDGGLPLTPVSTWLDDGDETGVESIRGRLGSRFHPITGCRYHPMFPVFKLAAMRAAGAALLGSARRIVSLKAMLIHRLTAVWIEDHGTASASGLFNVTAGEWDAEILGMLGLDNSQLPPIAGRTETVGAVTAEAAEAFGLPAGIVVIAGSGDGFLANIGSGCEIPQKIAITLGHSAVVRQTLSRPVLAPDGGTFCYRADAGAWLLGCAGSNGGNVLDWGRKIFGEFPRSVAPADPPIFIPLLHGERSPDWDPHRTGSWRRLTSRHTAEDLARSILEGVIFNLAHFLEIVQTASGERAQDLVLSGNGFLAPLAAPLLAGLVGAAAWTPAEPGLASLRGAGICALRALGLPIPELKVQRVDPLVDGAIVHRYKAYRQLRDL